MALCYFSLFFEVFPGSLISRPRGCLLLEVATRAMVRKFKASRLPNSSEKWEDNKLWATKFVGHWSKCFFFGHVVSPGAELSQRLGKNGCNRRPVRRAVLNAVTYRNARARRGLTRLGLASHDMRDSGRNAFVILMKMHKTRWQREWLQQRPECFFWGLFKPVIASSDLWPQEMFTFLKMLAMVVSESCFEACGAPMRWSALVFCTENFMLTVQYKHLPRKNLGRDGGVIPSLGRAGMGEKETLVVVKNKKKKKKKRNTCLLGAASSSNPQYSILRNEPSVTMETRQLTALDSEIESLTSWFNTAFFQWSCFLAHRLVVITHGIIKSGARKKLWRVGSSQPGKDGTHACSRFPFLSDPICCGSFMEDRGVQPCRQLLGAARTNQNVVM